MELCRRSCGKGHNYGEGIDASKLLEKSQNSDNLHVDDNTSVLNKDLKDIAAVFSEDEIFPLQSIMENSEILYLRNPKVACASSIRDLKFLIHP